MFCFSALVALAGALHSLTAEDAHHNIFRTSKRERESIHFWLVRLNKLQFVSHLDTNRLTQPFAPETCEQFGLENGALLNSTQQCVRSSAGCPVQLNNAETQLTTN